MVWARHEQQLVLAEEFLLLLILLVTEMPIVPDPPEEAQASPKEENPSRQAGEEGFFGPAATGATASFRSSVPVGQAGGSGGGGGVRTDSRLARQLRRELVHRLASSPCTHSKLQDTYYAVLPNETLESEVRIFVYVCMRFLTASPRPVCVLCGWFGRLVL